MHDRAMEEGLSWGRELGWKVCVDGGRRCLVLLLSIATATCCCGSVSE